jgi:hypothetical protein
MKINAARFISIVAHPFVLLTLLVFLPRFQSDAGGAFRATLVFVGIVFVPLAVLIWRAVASGRWATVDASDRADRPLLYAVSVVVLIAAIAYFYVLERSSALVRGSIVSAVMLMLTAALNHWIKISLHLTFACFCGILLCRVRLSYGLPVLLLVPALIWARVVLLRHVLSETICGLILGISGAVVFLCT